MYVYQDFFFVIKTKFVGIKICNEYSEVTVGIGS